MNRRDFLKVAGSGLASFAVLESSAHLALGAANHKRPNILWIVAEDFCPDLSCYGTEVVKTPNIDKLASQGALFTNAFTTAPVCSASRSAFMTGMYQTTIGAHQHRAAEYKPLADNLHLITHYFQKAGYFTSNSGQNWKKPGKTDFNFKVKKAFDGTDYRQRKPGQNFFSQINFSETHRDFKRDTENPIDPDTVKLPPYYPDHPITRRDWADYLECAQVLDKKVGKVLQRLEDDGLADNTIVFFFGDNGRPHIRGKQFLYEGGIHVPLIIRWPGHIKPGTIVDDLVSAIDFGPTCMSLVGMDIPPHMQGSPFLGPKKSKQRNYIFAARDRCDETVERIRCVRDKRFKYIRNYRPHLPYMQPNMYKMRQYPVYSLMPILYAQGKLTPDQARFMAPVKPAEELYDLTNDPHELNNLADKPEHKDVLKRMSDLLDEWVKQTNDKGEIPEDPALAARVCLNKHAPWHKNVMEKRGLTVDITPHEYLKYWQKRLGCDLVD